MINAIFNFLDAVSVFFWSYIGFSLIVVLGLFFSIKTRFFQIRGIPAIFRTFFRAMTPKGKEQQGIHPLQAFFASVGGAIGIGNVVWICTAIQLGGPGALFWAWVASACGALIKYCEIFLGLKHRIPNKATGSYDGGPMYFLPKAFRWKGIGVVISLLLCIYGVEIYQFSVITDSVVMGIDTFSDGSWTLPTALTGWLPSGADANKLLIGAFLLGLIIYAACGGVSRVGKVCSGLLPLFMTLYMVMSIWVIIQNWECIPELVDAVIKTAFSSESAAKSVIGGSVIVAIQYGMSSAAYSGDLGIGYDSIIHSESSVIRPEHQARLAVLGIFTDTAIYTMSILVILISGVWAEEIDASVMVQHALGEYFPHTDIFMPVFIILLGYSTIIAYFCVGIKCARFLSPRWGTRLYLAYGVVVMLTFLFLDQGQARVIMTLCGGALLLLNLTGIILLRKQVLFVTD